MRSIHEHFEAYQSGTINEEGRQFAIDNYSLEVFRKQIYEIVGRQLL